MYQLPVTKSETPTVIWVISGSSVLSPGFSLEISSKMPTKTGTMKATTTTMTTISDQAEDDRRVHHRRPHLAPQGVELLELDRDAVERLLEAARALAGIDHRAVERVEDAGLALHRLGNRAAGLDVAAQAEAIAGFSISSSVWSSSV